MCDPSLKNAIAIRDFFLSPKLCMHNLLPAAGNQ